MTAISLKTVQAAKRERTKRIERWLAVFATVTLVIAWFVGLYLEGDDTEAALAQAWPEAERFESVSNATYAAYQGDQLLGYIATGQADGYGGPMQMAVAVDLDGLVQGMAIISNKETPSFVARVTDRGFLDQMMGKSYGDGFVLGEDVKGVTGATYTSRAMAGSILAGSQIVAGEQLGLAMAEPEPIPIQFGIPEITLILLYATAWVAHHRQFKYTKHARWATLITGMVVIGFWYNMPLTISRINSFLLGYWPQWQTGLYWYLLLGGILFVVMVDNKNAYCQWFCPFGAAQECMGAIGGAKYNIPRSYRRTMQWVVRGLAWLAILIACLMRSPGITSYEVFGTLFSFTGSTVLFVLLGIVLVTSLFIKRPWCNYLCPLDPVYDIIALVRAWSLELWDKTRTRLAAR